MRLRVSGDAGDFIYSLALLRNLGGGDLVVCDAPILREPFIPRLPLVRAVAEAQPYVKSLKVGNNEPYDIDTTNFRRLHQRWMSLLECQIQEVESVIGGKISHDSSPWLSNIEPHSYSYGRIIVARSHRYRNPYFPWKELVKDLGDRMLFVGTRDEHNDFENHFGWVERFITKNLHEVGQLIAGADLFIGNQSSPHAVAMGLGGKMVQETSLTVPDCILKRDNVIYGTDNRFELEGNTYMDREVDEETVDVTQAPPGLWQFNHQYSHSISQLVDWIWNEDRSIPKKDLRKQIIHANVLRARGHFFLGQYVDNAPWKEAFENAGIPYTPTK